MRFWKKSWNPPTGDSKAQCKGGLAFGTLRFGILRERRATLEDLTFDLPVGAVCALVGRNGSGKTTALSLIPRLLAPDSDQVLVEGVPTTDWDLQSLRGDIAMVPQGYEVLNLTIRGNITTGRPGIPDSAVAQTAKLAGAALFISRLPKEYEPPLESMG